MWKDLRINWILLCRGIFYSTISSLCCGLEYEEAYV